MLLAAGTSLPTRRARLFFRGFSLMLTAIVFMGLDFEEGCSGPPVADHDLGGSWEAPGYHYTLSQTRNGTISGQGIFARGTVNVSGRIDAKNNVTLTLEHIEASQRYSLTFIGVADGTTIRGSRDGVNETWTRTR